MKYPMLKFLENLLEWKTFLKYYIAAAIFLPTVEKLEFNEVRNKLFVHLNNLRRSDLNDLFRKEYIKGLSIELVKYK